MNDIEKQILLYARVNTILSGCSKKGIFVSNLKLQKLLYLSYGAHLKNGGDELEYLEFEAWRHGPVIPEVYRYYKNFGDDPISKQMKSLDESFPSFQNNDSVNEIVMKYGNFDVWALVEETHKDSGAWHTAYELNKSNKLEFDDIKNEFSTTI